MEERFLSRFFADEELHVVNHKYVARAIFLSKTIVLVVGLVANDADKLGNERFRTHVKYVGVFPVFKKIIAYCVQKVRLSETYARVDKERIVASARVLSNSLASRQSVLVGFAYDEIFKGVFFKERAFFLAFFFGCEVCDKTLVFDKHGLLVEILVLFIRGDDNDVRYCGIERGYHFFNRVEVSRVDSAFCVCGNSRQNHCVVDEANRLQFFYPHLVTYGLYGYGQFILCVFPKFFDVNHIVDYIKNVDFFKRKSKKKT